MKKFAILLLIFSFLFGIILNSNILTNNNEKIEIVELEAFADSPIENYFMNHTANDCWICEPDEGWCNVDAQCCMSQWPYCEKVPE